MKICMAGTESSLNLNFHAKYGLFSFFYLQKIDKEKAFSHFDEILIDSGAFTFQQKIHKPIENYVKEYKEFIKKYTNDKRFLGFFELDIDNKIGFEKVLKIRRELESISDKIIPVWHKNRGINNFIEMCKEYKGKRVAVSGFKDEDIIDAQYNLFINTAHREGCNIHLLGLTRDNIIKNSMLNASDSVDSAVATKAGAYGDIILPLYKSFKRSNILNYVDNQTRQIFNIEMFKIWSYQYDL